MKVTKPALTQEEKDRIIQQNILTGLFKALGGITTISMKCHECGASMSDRQYNLRKCVCKKCQP